MAKPFTHFILTRFNLRRKIKLADDWLHKRIFLFQNYCLPSVEAQTKREFYWLVLFDKEAMQEMILKNYIELWQRRLPQFIPVACGAFKGITASTCAEEFIQQKIKEEQPENILTTRIDNDDAIHGKFINSIHTAAKTLYKRKTKFQALDFPYGYRLDFQNNAYYLYRRPHSPFLSLWEKHTGKGWKFRTIYSFPEGHGFIWKYVPVTQLNPNTPMWLQIIHDTNISNVMKGTEEEIPKDKIKGFEWLK